MKKSRTIDKILKLMFIVLACIGLFFTLYYIFYSSTALLNSDSVITDFIAHQQRINKEFFLSNWYYGNEFWIFSLSIPTLLLSFFINNNLLLRQICVFITAIIFFVILYMYGKKFIDKKNSIILITIFLSGISYSVLDYFYAFNAYLTVIINSLITIYIFKKAFETNDKKYFILSIILNLLINLSSLRYFPSVTLPLIITELLFIIIKTKSIKIIKHKDTKKILAIVISAIIGLCIFYLLINIYHYEQRAGTQIIKDLNFNVLYNDIKALIEQINNFFGYDNKNNPITFLAGYQYFVPNTRYYEPFSILNITNIVKIIMAILIMIVSPIILIINCKKNSKNINFLLAYNIVSWMIMILCYIVTTRFFYNYSELKYFLLNIIINIILFIYCFNKYLAKKYISKIIFSIFIGLYIISNLYTTYLTIKDNNKEFIEKKYELSNLLQENNLNFGYGSYWNSLITSYLSDYKITVASIGYYSSIKPYKWYSDESWYSKEKHKGRIFLIFDEIFIQNVKYYTDMYGNPDEILTCDGFYVYVYNKNVVAEKFT